MSKEQIKAEIEKLEKEKAEVKGSNCEVYSRVVGYLRPGAKLEQRQERRI